MEHKRIVFLCGMVLGLGLLMTQSSCYYDKEDKLYPVTALCDTVSISYVASIKPIISANCYSCHSTANYASLGGGTNLELFTSLTNQVNNGNLICDIQHSSSCNPMPQGAPKLSDCDINKIVAWKTAGTPNN